MNSSSLLKLLKPTKQCSFYALGTPKCETKPFLAIKGSKLSPYMDIEIRLPELDELFNS